MKIKTICNCCGKEIDLDDWVIYSNNTIKCIDCAMYKIWWIYDSMYKIDCLVINWLRFCMTIFVAFILTRFVAFILTR